MAACSENQQIGRTENMMPCVINFFLTEIELEFSAAGYKKFVMEFTWMTVGIAFWRIKLF
jgi:hypothetical protein